jgi:hypothetical protein
MNQQNSTTWQDDWRRFATHVDYEEDPCATFGAAGVVVNHHGRPIGYGTFMRTESFFLAHTYAIADKPLRFQLTSYRDMFSGMLGWRPARSGDTDFDQKVIVQTKDMPGVNAFLPHVPLIRELLFKQKRLSLYFKDAENSQGNVVRLAVEGSVFVQQYDAINTIHLAFTQLIDQLVAQGVISERAPNRPLTQLPYFNN